MTQAFYKRRRRWAQQPPFFAQVDWSNPLTRGLIVAFHPSSRIDSVNQSKSISLGDAATLSTEKLTTTAAGSSSTTYGTLSELSGATAFSSLVIATPGTLVARSSLWGRPTGASNNGGPGFGMGYSTPSSMFAYIDESTTYVAEGGAGTFVAGERAVFGWVYNYSASSKNKFFKNGKVVYSAGNTGAATGPDVSNSNLLLNGHHNTGSSLRPWQGSTELTLIWNRALSDIEFAEVSRNPWILFKSLDSRIWLPSVGGSLSYTITPLGSITLQGQSSYNKEKLFSSFGLITYSGSSSLIQGTINYIISPTGMITYNGTDKIKVVKTITTTGSIVYNGMVIKNSIRTQVPVGSINYYGTTSMYMPGTTIATTNRLLTGVGK